MDDLLNLPEATPPWKLKADRLGITTTYNDEAEKWSAEINWFYAVEYESGDTEKEAINALIFRLKL